MATRRSLNFAGALACAGLMAYALYAQYVLQLAPCPLCVFQRLGIIALGVVFLLAAMHNPGKAGGAAVGGAGRHVWLQSLPPDKVPACGPGLDFMLDQFPLAEALQMVLSGSGECADVDWSLLGFSMPAWVLIAAAALTLYGLYANLFVRRD